MVVRLPAMKRPGFDSLAGKTLLEKKMTVLSVFLPGESLMDRGGLGGQYSWGHRKEHDLAYQPPPRKKKEHYVESGKRNKKLSR